MTTKLKGSKASVIDFDEKFFEDKIKHHGILGMKWGRRLSRLAKSGKSTLKKISDIDSKRREKYQALAKSRDSASTSDRSRFIHASKPLSARTRSLIGKTAKTAIMSMAVQSIVMGTPIKRLNVSLFIKKAFKRNLTNEVKDEIFANLASKKYDQYGNLKPKFKSQKKKIFGFNKPTREDKLSFLTDVGYNTINNMGPILTRMMGRSVKEWSQKQKAKREQYEKWGEKILNERVPNVVWTSEDGSMSVISPN